jgi:hypothetical protein
MAEAIGSLSDKGWIHDVKPKADKLMGYYMTSNYSQSNLFFGEIVSLPKQIQEHNSDPVALRELIRSDLERILGRFYDSVSVDVSTSLANQDDPGRLNVTVQALVAQDGQTYSLGRLIESVNGKVVKIIKLNNEGTSP